MGEKRVARQRGVAVVEFAFVAPVLFAVVFAIIDFGWAFSQNVDLKHAAREGARVAAVNGTTCSGCTADERRDALVAEIRARSPELEDSETEVFVALVDGPDANGTSGDRGDLVVVCIRYPLRSLSGVTTALFSGDMTTKGVMRMEQAATFSAGGSSSPAWSGGACTA